LLTPAAVIAGALGSWAFAASLNWTGGFAFSSGLLSHWQVWIGGAALLEFSSRLLYRYSRKNSSPTP
jgi:hypothetical protein